MTKIFLIVSAVLLMASAALGFLNKGKLAEKQMELVSTKASVDGARNDATKAKAEQKKAESAKTEAEGKATDLETKLTAVNNEISSLNDKVTKAEADVKAKQADIETLNQKLAAATPPPAMTPPPGMAEDLDKAKHQLAELQLIKDGLEGQLKSAREAQQAAERRVAQREQADQKTGLTGRVLAVDRNWNFVVLNLGGRSGVNANETMVIRRGTSLVGRVRVTSVEPTQSIADIVPNSVPAGVSVQTGDTVVYAGGS